MGEAGREPLVVVAGNPNTGKTTLFNRLTGLDHRVGNYPGITVDRHTGRAQLGEGRSVRLDDLPGTYSLSARSAEEQIALQAICGLGAFERPDAVLVVLDATQLTRNLYLALQVLELGLPVVAALTMGDMLGGRGLSVDAAALARDLGVPVVPVVARQGRGLDELRRALARAVDDPASCTPGPRTALDVGPLAEDLDAVGAALPAAWQAGEGPRARALAAWALLSVDERDELEHVPQDLRAVVAERRAAASAAGRDLDLELVGTRYAWIDAHAPGFLTSDGHAHVTWTDRLDRVLLSPLLGVPVFLAVMTLLFQALFTWSDPLIGAVEQAFEWLGARAGDALPEGFLRDLVTEGLIAGVGSVVVFLPQILLLFLMLGVLEASGYMARVAYLVDRLMKRLGLTGRAFVPMLSGFACAIPAIMATRTMERRQDRLKTMLVVPFMACSARLPVYTLVIGTLFPPNRWLGIGTRSLLMVGLYLFGTLVALGAAWALSRTVLRGQGPAFVLELPPYRLPDPRDVLREAWLKGRAFLTQAGTVILACTIGMWLLLSYPGDTALDASFDARRADVEREAPAEELEERLLQLEQERTAALLEVSYAGRLGRTLEPALAPLGFDWRIDVGLIGAFAAREVFVSTMGLVYGIGGDVDEESESLRDRITDATRRDGSPVYTPLVGLSLLVFFALACQCMSTLAVVKRETGGWRWPLFLFTYMTALAWLASFAVYQGGRLLGYA